MHREGSGDKRAFRSTESASSLRRLGGLSGLQREGWDEEDEVRAESADFLEASLSEQPGVFGGVADVDDGDAAPWLENADHFAQRLLPLNRVVEIVQRPA